MQTRKNKPVEWEKMPLTWYVAFLLFLVGLASLLMTMPAWADDDCKGHSCNGGGDVDVTVNTGDVSVPLTNNIGVEGSNLSTSVSHSSRAYGFSHSLGSAAFADCMGSEQVGTVIASKQWLGLNKWCAAEIYDSRGKHKMAALLRCDISDIRKHFASEQECVEENIYTPPPPVILQRQDNSQLQALRAEVAELRTKYEEVQARPTPALTKTVIKQETFLDADKRAKLMALKGEENNEGSD